MAEPIEEIIEEVKQLQEYNLSVTKEEIKMLLSYISLTAAVMGSSRFKHLLILDPDLLLVVALVHAVDPKVVGAEALADRLLKIIGE